MSLYARIGLFFLRPILDAYNEQRVSERQQLMLVTITRDIRKRAEGGELHL